MWIFIVLAVSAGGVTEYRYLMPDEATCIQAKTRADWKVSGTAGFTHFCVPQNIERK